MKSAGSSGEILLGNGAIARGLVEAGVHAVTSYPGTPSSEIVPEVVRFVKMHHLPTYVEWSTNEKVAFDNAYAVSLTGKRSAVVMKQVGLNVAADSLMSAAYTGVLGGMIIVSCDDPGPHSSQTEQDSRLFAFFAKIPAFDPSSPEEAREMVNHAFALSEEFEIPVLMRPAIRVCHARQYVRFREPIWLKRPAFFRKNPGRWAATPRFRYELHKRLNQKLQKIALRLDTFREFNYHDLEPKKRYPFGLITGGVQYANVVDILAGAGRKVSPGSLGGIPVLKLGVPFPFPQGIVEEFLSRVDRCLIIEETSEVIEIYLRNRSSVWGRSTGHVPLEGELVPERVYEVLSRALVSAGLEPLPSVDTGPMQELIGNLELPVQKPTLCPGCGHRPAFYAIRKSYPTAIFTSDIGCYTLGVNLKAVDTCLDMGGGITLASGFYHSFHQDGKDRPIIATMGDSTFYHAGMVGLTNAVYNRSRFVLVLLDNDTTAMTGMQPTPGIGIKADGSKGNRITLEEAVRGCGVKWVRIHDPYDVPGMMNLIKEAHNASRGEDGSVSVIIARHPCIVGSRIPEQNRVPVTVTGDCNGCRVCIKLFDCPALNFDEEKGVVSIDNLQCIDCGVCIHACPINAIVKVKEPA